MEKRKAFSVKGTYVLLLRIKKAGGISVGCLGKVLFERGNYAYVGSGMNNLHKRVKRHFASKKKIFWHIDYLLSSPYAELQKAILMPSARKGECKTAREIGKSAPAVKGFGCSDCKCDSHLFKLEEMPRLRGLEYIK